MTTMGSSPLTRGARFHRGRGLVLPGLIPAHAGSTISKAGLGPWVPAHPRSRGEHILVTAVPDVGVGSSPLTRGALVPPPVVGRPSRLIPAHAGSTVGVHVEHVVEGAHPRSRGEHIPPSGPRVSLRRLIPAHAGSTAACRRLRRLVRAHPRSRGEHPGSRIELEWFQGSSPLTRGARTCCGSSPTGSGLIPAHAGSTPLQRGFSYATTAHPRSRGEHLSCAPDTCCPAGSSPLTRGALDGGTGHPAGRGLIPAHAGSTRKLFAAGRPVWAHPRSRGEHV